MLNKYLMVLLSVGILGVGMTAMGQEKETAAPAQRPEARGGRPGGPGMGRGMMIMSKEVREANQKLRQLVREYDKDKTEQNLEEIKKQAAAIQDIQIKELEDKVADMKAKKDENVNQIVEQVKSGEFQKQLNRPRQGGGEHGGRNPGEGAPKK